jgi:hypothetical protein
MLYKETGRVNTLYVGDVPIFCISIAMSGGWNSWEAGGGGGGGRLSRPPAGARVGVEEPGGGAGGGLAGRL